MKKNKVNIFIVILVLILVVVIIEGIFFTVRRFRQPQIGTVTIFDNQGVTQNQYRGRVKIIEDGINDKNVEVHVYLDFDEED